MDTSNWLTIIGTTIGCCISATISWVFFRAQQKTNFEEISKDLKILTKSQEYLNNVLSEQNRKQDKIIKNNSKLSSSFSILQQTISSEASIDEKLDILKELQGIKYSVENVNNDLKDLPKSMIYQISKQQDILIKDVQEKFEQEVVRSRKVLFDSVTTELTFINDNGNNQESVNKIIELVEYALKGMGDFQRESIQTETNKIFSDIEKTVGDSLKNVSQDINDLTLQVEKIALPVPI